MDMFSQHLRSICFVPSTFQALETQRQSRQPLCTCRTGDYSSCQASSMLFAVVTWCLGTWQMRCFFSSVALRVIGRKPHFAPVLGSCSFNSSRWSLNMPLVYTAPDIFQASQVTQWVKNLLPEQETPETQVQSLGQEDSLEKEMPAHSGILPGKIPWTEEPGGLQFMGLERVKHNTGIFLGSLGPLSTWNALSIALCLSEHSCSPSKSWNVTLFLHLFLLLPSQLILPWSLFSQQFHTF